MPLPEQMSSTLKPENETGNDLAVMVEEKSNPV
jgi:hypothetical protein